MKDNRGLINLTLIWALIVVVAVLFYWNTRYELMISPTGFLLTGADFLRIEPRYPPESPGHKNIQPIQFPHTTHTDPEKVGLECDFCHYTVRTSRQATIPNLETCMSCHSTPVTEEIDEEDKIREYAERGEKIPWIQLNRLPPHVYFSHARHVTAGRLACINCMGDMGSQPVPPPEPLMRLRMEYCLNCHVKTGQTQDCLLCHM
jgi:hypothetical protein